MNMSCEHKRARAVVTALLNDDRERAAHIIEHDPDMIRLASAACHMAAALVREMGRHCGQSGDELRFAWAEAVNSAEAR